MMTAATRSSTGMSMAFPDVCKVPGPPAGGVPIPYPNVASTARQQQQSKSPVGPARTGVTAGSPVSPMSMSAAARVMGAPKVALQGEIMQLHGELNTLHNQLKTLPRGNPDVWQAKLEQYLSAAAALYITMMMAD